MGRRGTIFCFFRRVNQYNQPLMRARFAGVRAWRSRPASIGCSRGASVLGPSSSLSRDAEVLRKECRPRTLVMLDSLASISCGKSDLLFRPVICLSAGFGHRMPCQGSGVSSIPIGRSIKQLKLPRGPDRLHNLRNAPPVSLASGAVRRHRASVCRSRGASVPERSSFSVLRADC